MMVLEAIRYYKSENFRDTKTIDNFIIMKFSFVMGLLNYLK